MISFAIDSCSGLSRQSMVLLESYRSIILLFIRYVDPDPCCRPWQRSGDGKMYGVTRCLRDKMAFLTDLVMIYSFE